MFRKLHFFKKIKYNNISNIMQKKRILTLEKHYMLLYAHNVIQRV